MTKGTKGTNVIVGAALVAALFVPQMLPAQAIQLRPGMVITRSVRIAPRVYRLSAPASPDSALIVIRGDDITVDFAGAALEGQTVRDDPDLAAGVAIRVEGGHNVRIIRPRIRGYKIGILARGTSGLVIENGDLSWNWKPRLFSLVEHESLADWLSFHHNENREWLRFGAAIYLDSVVGGRITDTRAVQGMNGLLMNRTSRVRIERCDFSFNSGLGIGLYRSSDNTIVYNKVEFDVRGYSHGFYRRGQDSAGLLMYEQSNNNVVAWNTVTHGGDGLFVWAGQTTMDSGQGGVNDNLFFGNDFSWAPANGMEATFSRNTFVANLLEGNDYGLWGGYSFASKVIGNRFVRNRIGVAIEHGQDNAIEGNRFDHDTTAISLWANPIEPSDWGYPRHRDTRSRDYRIARNAFIGNRAGVRAVNTAGLLLLNNHWQDVDSMTVLRDTTGFRSEGNVDVAEARGVANDTMPPLSPEYAQLVPESLGGPRTLPPSGLARRDRSAMIVDEWGPYDWLSPKLWPVDSTRAVPLRLRVVGPGGRWRIAAQRGVDLVSSRSGRIGDTIAVTPATPGDWKLSLVSGGKRFSYGRFEPTVQWNVKFFAWTDSVTFTTPVLTRTESRLDYMWYRPAIAGLPQAKFSLEATATVTLPAGIYSLRTISDDGVRVWVDGRLVIDDWTPHESAVDNAPIAGGTHQLKVQHYQAGGWTELRVEIVRGIQHSRGSPGPH